MATCPKWLFYHGGCYSLLQHFPVLIILPNIMTEQKEKGYQGIRATEVFEHENKKSCFKYCYYWEKWKTMFDYRDARLPGTQGVFSDIRGMILMVKYFYRWSQINDTNDK